MRKSFTAVIERNATFTANFETEPYEAGWASEARWFIRVLERGREDIAIRVFAQVSPDGLHWCDEGGPAATIHDQGLTSFALRDFGHWLRLRCELVGVDPLVKVMITLSLKE